MPRARASRSAPLTPGRTARTAASSASSTARYTRAISGLGVPTATVRVMSLLYPFRRAPMSTVTSSPSPITRSDATPCGIAPRGPLATMISKALSAPARRSSDSISSATSSSRMPARIMGRTCANTRSASACASRTACTSSGVLTIRRSESSPAVPTSVACGQYARSSSSSATVRLSASKPTRRSARPGAACSSVAGGLAMNCGRRDSCAACTVYRASVYSVSPCGVTSTLPSLPLVNPLRYRTFAASLIHRASTPARPMAARNCSS